VAVTPSVRVDDFDDGVGETTDDAVGEHLTKVQKY
jgi:tRNA A37 threonylcarbamoyltransferase TsaD